MKTNKSGQKGLSAYYFKSNFFVILASIKIIMNPSACLFIYLFILSVYFCQHFENSNWYSEVWTGLFAHNRNFASLVAVSTISKFKVSKTLWLRELMKQNTFALIFTYLIYSSKAFCLLCLHFDNEEISFRNIWDSPRTNSDHSFH